MRRRVAATAVTASPTTSAPAVPMIAHWHGRVAAGKTTDHVSAQWDVMATLAELDDNMIALEYEVPYNTSRIDCLFFGKGEGGTSNTALVELKQWSNVVALQDEGNFVETYTGGRTRTVAHPSQQVEGYHNHLLSFVQYHLYGFPANRCFTRCSISAWPPEGKPTSR